MEDSWVDIEPIWIVCFAMQRGCHTMQSASNAYCAQYIAQRSAMLLHNAMQWAVVDTLQYNAICIKCNAAQSYCIMQHNLQQMNTMQWAGGYDLTSGYVAIECNTIKCILCNAAQCWGVQSLILCKHFVFVQQPASMSPNIPNHNLEEVQLLQFITFRSRFRIKDWTQVCKMKILPLKSIIFTEFAESQFHQYRAIYWGVGRLRYSMFVLFLCYLAGTCIPRQFPALSSSQPWYKV